MRQVEWRKFARQWRWLTLAAVMTGCTTFCGVDRTKLTPEQVVERYLDVALNMSDISQKPELMSYTTGNLKAAIEAASDSVITDAYIDRRYSIISYSVVERRDRTPRETEITFTLIYKDLGKGDIKEEAAAKITTENTLSVVKEKKRWLIREVLGNKTSFDFPLSEESRITPRAPEDRGSDGTDGGGDDGGE